MASFERDLIREKRSSGVPESKATNLTQLFMNDLTLQGVDGAVQTFKLSYNSVPVRDSAVTESEQASVINKQVSKDTVSFYLKQFYTMYMKNDTKFRLGQVIAEKKDATIKTRYTDTAGKYYTSVGWTLVDGEENYAQMLFPPYKKQPYAIEKIEAQDDIWKYLTNEVHQDLKKSLNNRVDKFTYRKFGFKAINDTIMLWQWLFARAFGVVSTYMPEWDLSLYIQEGLVSQTYGTQPNFISLLNRFDQDCLNINSIKNDYAYRTSYHEDSKLGWRSAKLANFGVVNAAISDYSGDKYYLWDPSMNIHSHYWTPTPDASDQNDLGINYKNDIITTQFYDDMPKGLKNYYDKNEISFHKWWEYTYKMNKDNDLAAFDDTSLKTFNKGLKPYSNGGTFGNTFYGRLHNQDAENLALSAYGHSHLKFFNAFYSAATYGLTPEETIIDGFALGLHRKVDLIEDLLMQRLGMNYGSRPTEDPKEEMSEAIQAIIDADTSSVLSSGDEEGFRKRSGGFIKSKIVAALKNALDAITFLCSKNSKANAARKKVDSSTNSTVQSLIDLGGDTAAEALSGVSPRNTDTNQGPVGIDEDLSECSVTTGIPQHNPSFYGGPHGADLDPRTLVAYGQVDNSVLQRTLRLNVGDVRKDLRAITRNVDGMDNEANTCRGQLKFLQWSPSQRLAYIKDGFPNLEKPAMATFSGHVEGNFYADKIVETYGLATEQTSRHPDYYTYVYRNKGSRGIERCSSLGMYNCWPVDGRYSISSNGWTARRNLNSGDPIGYSTVNYLAISSQRYTGRVYYCNCTSCSRTYYTSVSYGKKSYSTSDPWINTTTGGTHYYFREYTHSWKDLYYLIPETTVTTSRSSYVQGNNRYETTTRTLRLSNDDRYLAQVSTDIVETHQSLGGAALSNIDDYWYIFYEKALGKSRFTVGTLYKSHHQINSSTTYWMSDKELNFWQQINAISDKTAKIYALSKPFTGSGKPILYELTLRASTFYGPSGCWRRKSHWCHTDTYWHTDWVYTPYIEVVSYIPLFVEPDTAGYSNAGANIENFIEMSTVFDVKNNEKPGLSYYTKSARREDYEQLFNRPSGKGDVEPDSYGEFFTMYGKNSYEVYSGNNISPYRKDNSYETGDYNKAKLADKSLGTGYGIIGKGFFTTIYYDSTEKKFYTTQISSSYTRTVESKTFPGFYLQGTDYRTTNKFLSDAQQTVLHNMFKVIPVLSSNSFYDTGATTCTYVETQLNNFITMAYWQAKYQKRGLDYIKDFFINEKFAAKDVMALIAEYIPSKLRYLADDDRIGKVDVDKREDHYGFVKVDDNKFVKKECLYEYNDWLKKAVNYFGHHNLSESTETQTIKINNTNVSMRNIPQRFTEQEFKTSLATAFDSYSGFLNDVITGLENLRNKSNDDITFDEIIWARDLISDKISKIVKQKDCYVVTDVVYAYLNVMYEVRKQFINFRMNKQDGTLAMCANLERGLPMVAAGALQNRDYGTTESPTANQLEDVKVSFYDVANSTVNKLRALEKKEPLPLDSVTYVYSPVIPATEAEYKADLLRRKELYEPEVIVYPKWIYKKNENGIAVLDIEGNPVKEFTGEFAYAKKPGKGEYVLISNEFKSSIGVDPSYWLIDWGLNSELCVNLPFNDTDMELGELEIVCNLNPNIDVNKLAKLSSMGVADIHTLLCGSQEGNDYWKIPVKAKNIPFARNYKTDIKLIPYKLDDKGNLVLEEGTTYTFATFKDLLYPIINNQDFDKILDFDNKEILENFRSNNLS